MSGTRLKMLYRTSSSAANERRDIKRFFCRAKITPVSRASRLWSARLKKKERCAIFSAEKNFSNASGNGCANTDRQSTKNLKVLAFQSTGREYDLRWISAISMQSSRFSFITTRKALSIGVNASSIGVRVAKQRFPTSKLRMKKSKESSTT